MRLRTPRRDGATAVEFALVSPVVMLFLIGLIVGGLGIFRYQEVAWLARKGARYASVHGARYELVTRNPAATAEDVYNQAILPHAIALDPKQINYSVTWNPDNKQNSLVTVTVRYRWIPESFFGGIDLTSTSTMMVSY